MDGRVTRPDLTLVVKGFVAQRAFYISGSIRVVTSMNVSLQIGGGHSSEMTVFESVGNWTA